MSEDCLNVIWVVYNLLNQTSQSSLDKVIPINRYFLAMLLLASCALDWDWRLQKVFSWFEQVVAVSRWGLVGLPGWGLVVSPVWELFWSCGAFPRRSLAGLAGSMGSVKNDPGNISSNVLFGGWFGCWTVSGFMPCWPWFDARPLIVCAHPERPIEIAMALTPIHRNFWVKVRMSKPLIAL